ncbi:MAG: hypothetical protein AMXMBFR53_29370 [Gemmatimonadota bacterium]
MTERSRRADQALRLLGLARRAGSVAPGTDAARRAVRSGEARLILMAGDASSVQMDKIRSSMRNRPIPWGTLGDRATLGAAVGRGPTSAVAITAVSLAKALERVLGLGGDTAPETEEEER